MSGQRVIDRGTSQAKSVYIGSAIDESDLDPYEFRVYCHLKRRAQDGEVWERQAKIAEICKMSRKTVNEVMTRLEEKGWIEQEGRATVSGQTSNLVYLLEAPCNPRLHPAVTVGYTPLSPTVTAEGTPLEGTPLKGKSVAPSKAKSREEKKQGKGNTGSGAAQNPVFDAIIEQLYPQGAASNDGLIAKVSQGLTAGGWTAEDVTRVLVWRAKDSWWAKKLTLPSFQKYAEDWRRESGVARRTPIPSALEDEDITAGLF